MSELPANWNATTLSNVCERIVDGSHNPPKGTSTGYAMLSARNIQDRKINFDEYRLISELDFLIEHQRTSVRPDDVLMTIVGTIGRTAVVGNNIEPFALQRSVAVIRAPQLNSQYLSYSLEAPIIQKLLNDSAKGTAQKGVYLGMLGNIEIPLAPLPEQKRIADKLDTLLARIDACRDRLDRIPKIIKQFRQSVLAAATSGHLTEDWRAAQADRVARMQPQAESELVARDAAQCRYEVTPTPDSNARHPGYELPWRNTNMGECGQVSGGLTKNPKRDNLALRKPYLRVANVYANSLDLDELQEIGLTAQEWQKTKLEAGDLLIVEGNGSLDQIGRVALWSDEVQECSHQNHIIRWRTRGELLPKFSLYWLLSPEGRTSIEEIARTTTGLHTLSITKVASLSIRLPSIPEQSEIVRRVESLFALADGLEARVATARARVASLTPATLAKAFRGELVPQDPNDEPASILLERIRAERAAKPPERRGRRGPAKAA